MVPVLRDSVEAGEEGRTEGGQAEHRLGQAAGLGLDCTGDVHLEERKIKKNRLCSNITLFTAFQGYRKNQV